MRLAGAVAFVAVIFVVASAQDNSAPARATKPLPERVAELGPLLASPERAVREAAQRKLVSKGPAGARVLLQHTEHPDPDVRRLAVEGLGLVGPKMRDHDAVVLSALDDDDPRVVEAAVLALGRIAHDSRDAVERLLRLAGRDDARTVRPGIIQTLGRMGDAADVAAPLFVESLRSESADERRAALQALFHHRESVGAAVPALTGLVQDRRAPDWPLAAAALRAIDPAAAVQAGLRDDPELESGARDRATLNVKPGDWPQWGGSRFRNNAPPGGNIPTHWDVQTGHNILWKAPLGSQAYGDPVVANGKVYVGTNNNHAYLARFPRTVDLGVLLCFDEHTGEFLWQYSSTKLPQGLVHDWPEMGICSSPVIDGDRLWVVTNRCEVVCLDAEGFRDGENDGLVRTEDNENKDEADVVWKLDMRAALGVFPHNMSCSWIIVADDRLFLCTSNGVDETHVRIPAPGAPSFIALERDTGRVVWTDSSPGSNILHGQWASPTYASPGGQPQVIFCGGDGWVYSFDPAGGGDGTSKLLWKFDCNPKSALYSIRSKSLRNHIIRGAMIYADLVYVAVGEDPEHGDGNGHLWCIDPTRRGDVSPELAVDADGNLLPPRRLQGVDVKAGEQAEPNPGSAFVWHYTGEDLDGDGKLAFEEEMHRTCGVPAIRDGLLYITDFAGIVHCVNAQTGRPCWTHDMLSASWGSPLIVDGKVYVGNEEGEVVVFEHAPEMRILAENEMLNSVYTTPIVANGVLFIATRDTLFAIQAAAAGD